MQVAGWLVGAAGRKGRQLKGRLVWERGGVQLRHLGLPSSKWKERPLALEAVVPVVLGQWLEV